MNPIEEAQLVLENDQAFYAAYHRAQKAFSPEICCREEIRRSARRLMGERFCREKLQFTGSRTDAAEKMRAYFDHRYSEGDPNYVAPPQKTSADNAGKPWDAAEDKLLLHRFDRGIYDLPTIAQLHRRTLGGIRARLEKHGRLVPHEDYALASPEPISFNIDEQPETTMSSTTPFFQNKQLLNGRDISTLSNTEIYGAISAKEAQIATLEGVKNKPKSLVREIKQHQDDIKALVDFLDSKESSVGETSAA